MKISHAIALIILSLSYFSCSVSTQLSRTAEKNLFKQEAFSPAFTGISIYEPSTGIYWYDHLAEKNFVPASNTKYLSCYAAMKYLGDHIEGIRYRINTDSTLVIRATGDPTFLHPEFIHQPVYTFISGFDSIEIERPAFPRYLGNGWSWNDYLQSYMTQRSAMPIYGNIVKISLDSRGLPQFYPGWFQNKMDKAGDISNGFKIEKPWDKNEFTLSPGAFKSASIPFIPDNYTLLNLLQDTLASAVSFVEDAGETPGVIYSQPLDSMLKRMMYRSDNFYAEQCLLMVSQKMFGYMDEKKVIDSLKNTDIFPYPQIPRWADGSGLSRYNNFSPRDFIFLLDKMADEFGMDRLKNILPTGGTGTLSSYYLADQGQIFAKTGTLNGVIALSGYLTTKKNKQLIFSILVNHHNSEASEIRKAIEKFVRHVRNNF